MGVIRTDEWLDKNFADPLKICEELKESFGNDERKNIYQYLLKFGMYKPNNQTYRDFQKLKEMNMWECVEEIFTKYQKKWKGPNIPVYIFPIMATNGLFQKSSFKKAGLAFIDKLFLFLSPIEDEREIEALLVHEYHHTCRLNKQGEKVADFTLMDSLILEGLAEHAVKLYCGEKYLAEWCNYYSRKETQQFWEERLQNKLDVKKRDKLHDEILFGMNGYPKLMGYAVGYELISMFNKKNKLTIRESFFMESKRFIKDLKSE
ncbi:uncharacterized protein YjaZ [Cytobacillus eiseniae]|uniref:Uncharacterized protein YjaZ n=1 Tax=Cytobacillus eiseniae TaxID=762947 RepID=A0ABS4RE28_9BACI|nr:DUF2268 domain-containing putative Zn-dependent protease [Cytobacillus eiseniae]MBP2241162.1 uncharacterized protein YjaZ [Cytobacillus eiseniae]